jgi:hypothetical protein
MKRLLCVTAGAVILSGCATYESPHTVLQSMDAKAPRYETDECRQARQEAMAFDENVGGRVGVGLALGLFLGPLALPLAAAGDVAHGEKRKAAVALLKDACDGDLAAGPSGPALLRLQQDLARLETERAQGRLPEAEYRAQREALVAQHLDKQVAGAGRALVVGTELVLRDREPLSGTTLHETRLLVTDVGPEAVVFNGGDLSLWRRTAKVRGGRMPGAALSGFEVGALKQGDSLKATFQPANHGDEAVPVEVHIEGEEAMAVTNGSIPTLRARLKGFASFEAPYGSPQAWRGAPIAGQVWIDRTSGLVLKAAVDCSYPTYALKRDLMRATLPVRAE